MLAWRDAVYIGMACHGQLINSKSTSSEERHLVRQDTFFQTWCKHPVFCKGDAWKPKWKLAPTLTASFPIQTWDMD
jgi:hypothetical protein